jgi:hypothetical protein
MRPHTQQLLDTIRKGGYRRRRVADLYYGRARVADNVPLVDPKLVWKGSDKIQGSGSTRVVWQGRFGESIVPRWAGDTFAPFGPTLFVRDVIQAGGARWEIPLGWFPIVDVPNAQDQRMKHQGRSISIGSVLDLTLADRMSELRDDPFDAPQAPGDLTSAVAETSRMTGFQITRSVPDAKIPRTVVYQDDRLDALYDLCRVVLDAVPYMTSDDTLSFRPNAWPQPVDELVFGGPKGTVQSIGNGMSTDGVKNYVVVRSQGSDGAVLYRSYLREGPLRPFEAPGVYAPARVRKLILSSQYVTTAPEAKSWGDRELLAASRITAKDVPIVLPYNPLYEVGDVLQIWDTFEQEYRRYRLTEVPLEPTGAQMTVTAEVAK